jgi:tetratricopeptide (TPR) repeat protein
MNCGSDGSRASGSFQAGRFAVWLLTVPLDVLLNGLLITSVLIIALPPDFPLQNLADVRSNQGRYGEAESLSSRALAIREKDLGPDAVAVAYSLNQLGWAMKQRGRYAKAEPLFKRALTFRKKRLGLDHPYTAITLQNLADAISNHGHYREAEPQSRRALAIREKALGAQAPEVAISANELAWAEEQQGRYAEAESLDRALGTADQPAVPGPDHRSSESSDRPQVSGLS